MALAAALALACGSARPFELRNESLTYAVPGTTAGEIRAALDRLGPFDPLTGQRRDALTSWQLDWQVDTRQSGARCELSRAQVALRITRTLPRLEDPGALAPEVRRDWGRHLAALRQYGEERAQIAVRAAREIESAFKGMARNDCPSLKMQAEATARSARDRARAQDTAYEQQTDRGRSLGARFPWTEGDPSELTEAERRKLEDRVARPPQ
jgi:predicted secreted Zn-dependent protease